MGYAHRSSLSIQINANPLLVCPVRMAESSLVVIRCIRARGMVSGRPDSGVKPHREGEGEKVKIHLFAWDQCQPNTFG